MLSSEPLMRVLHTDRMKDLERVARERRMLETADETLPGRLPAVRPGAATATRRGPCGDSATLPA